ncbi:uncharacterized protein KY384_004738 [Bacidia gigantensis]|uniref:uncharacterized protein n=1 Tax=Bacidia gigantensis TaxID=2732470 RepID=UPI001D054609|nr:uncharacterized protein KY384_004738 [Bacidia gigantensis]KAG8530238.1 hypothetical protein KY384_004738 [Bacidia gigantensis]
MKRLGLTTLTSPATNKIKKIYWELSLHDITLSFLATATKEFESKWQHKKGDCAPYISRAHYRDVQGHFYADIVAEGLMQIWIAKWQSVMQLPALKGMIVKGGAWTLVLTECQKGNGGNEQSKKMRHVLPFEQVGKGTTWCRLSHPHGADSQALWSCCISKLVTASVNEVHDLIRGQVLRRGLYATIAELKGFSTPPSSPPRRLLQRHRQGPVGGQEKPKQSWPAWPRRSNLSESSDVPGKARDAPQESEWRTLGYKLPDLATVAGLGTMKFSDWVHVRETEHARPLGMKGEGVEMFHGGGNWVGAKRKRVGRGDRRVVVEMKDDGGGREGERRGWQARVRVWGKDGMEEDDGIKEEEEQEENDTDDDSDITSPRREESEDKEDDDDDDEHNIEIKTEHPHPHSYPRASSSTPSLPASSTPNPNPNPSPNHRTTVKIEAPSSANLALEEEIDTAPSSPLSAAPSTDIDASWGRWVDIEAGRGSPWRIYSEMGTIGWEEASTGQRGRGKVEARLSILHDTFRRRELADATSKAYVTQRIITDL